MNIEGGFTQRILVDIDCLFDTRLGWLSVHHPEALAKLVPPAYYNRFTDVWAEIIGIKDYHAKFAKRGVEALKAAKPTVYFDVLGARLEAMLLQIQLSSPLERPTLTINMYPYTMDAPTFNEFRKMFADVYDMVNVDLIYESPEALTPSKLKGRWDAYAIWDWFEWIKHNAKQFEKVKLPGFPFYVIAMFTPELTPEVMEKLGEKQKNPFLEARREMAEFLLLEHIDSALFSLDPEYQGAYFPKP
jgi:hypothetical protein